MNFSRVALSDEEQAFQEQLRTVLQTLVIDEVIQRDRETGENFDEGVHRALGLGRPNHAPPANRGAVVR